MVWVDIPREVVHEMVQEAREKKIKRAEYVRAQITERYPQFVTETVRRGGESFNALDYLISDLDSYA